MTWKELAQYIQEMPQRFLDTAVQLYDCVDGTTYYRGIELLNDCTEDDYTIDLGQPQIFFRIDENDPE